MSRISKDDVATWRKTIDGTGEVRFHIIYSRSNLSVVCRLWHPDGHVLGRANGGGYDRAGAALGQAIEALFPEELKGLKAGYEMHRVVGGARDGQLEGNKVKDGIYGLTRTADGSMSLDGSCGIEQMLKVLVALGFTRTDKYETGASSSMVLARKQ